MVNPFKEGTTSWYKWEIKNKLTPMANKRIVEAREAGTKSKQLETMIERLQKYGGTDKRYSKDAIGLGFKGKTKSRLKRQYQELMRVQKIDVWTPRGIKEYEAQEKNNYSQFKKSHPGWSRDKWRDFVQMMGTVSSEMLREFGYERHGNEKGSKTVSANSNKTNQDLMEAFNEAYQKGKDMQEIMEKVSKEANGAGLDQRRTMDLLYKAIRSDINNIDWDNEIRELQADMQREE